MPPLRTPQPQEYDPALRHPVFYTLDQWHRLPGARGLNTKREGLHPVMQGYVYGAAELGRESKL